MIDSPEISDQVLESNLIFIAKVIDRYGDEYWPIFEGLESALNCRKARKAKLRKKIMDSQL